jgi:hypothetical protein
MAAGEQGAWAVGRFAIYALVLGWVAVTRKSLIPWVVCHVTVDCCAGLSG